MTEARRGLIRLTSNYVRLFTNVVLGLLAVRLLLTAVGNDGWAIVALLGSTVGLAGMATSIVEKSMVRELGSAYHKSEDVLAFGAAYNTALLLVVAIGLLTVGIMAVVWMIIPVLEVPPDLVGAARWLLACKAVETFVTIVVAPAVTMFKVTERMVGANLGRVVNRLGPFLAAVWLLVRFDEIDAASGIVTYGTVSATLVVIGKLAHTSWIVALEHRLIPNLKLASREALKAILKIGGWNTIASVAMGMHIRLDNILMNLYFGLFGNVTFGLATVLGGYVRMITTGMTAGVDAVATRIDATGEKKHMRRLLYHSTRLHAMVTIPAAIGMFVLAEDLLVGWVGNRLQDPSETLSPTVMLIRLLTVGMACRAIGDGWVALLYGGGHVRQYAPVVLIGGLINPALAIGLILVLPDSYAYVGPTISYALIFLIVHMGIIPWQMGRIAEMSYWRVLAPLGPVTIIALVCTPILFLIPEMDSLHKLVRLGIRIGAYAAVYGLLTYLFVLKPAERARMVNFASRRLLRRPVAKLARRDGRASAAEQ